MGKGSARRPAQETKAETDEKYERIFGEFRRRTVEEIDAEAERDRLNNFYAHQPRGRT